MVNLHFLSFFLFFCMYYCEEEITGHDVLVLVNFQPYSLYHATRMSIFRRHIVSQLPTNQPPKIIISDNDTTSILFHLILPALSFYRKEISDYKWVLFVQEETRLELKQLYHYLSEFNYNLPNLLGLAMKDVDRSIIHHFSEPYTITYPHREVGFVMSISLVKMIINKLEQTSITPERYDTHIDPQYEMVKFIRDKIIKNFRMTNSSEFCLTKEPNDRCVSWISSSSFLPDCAAMIDQDQYLVVVKTCKKFFGSRIPIIKRTWVPDVHNILYFAEITDSKIPTVSTGVPNTEIGHCAKLKKILEIVANDPKWNNVKFLIIVDDDTLLSIPRLRKLLHCYRQDQRLALGERYAYMTWYGSGYDYLTGGSGIVLSMSVVREVISKSFCHNKDWPDDMILGMWLDSVNQSIIHNHLFHQARPEDYPYQRIDTQHSISFHKFWETNPDKLYHKYLNHTNFELLQTQADDDDFNNEGVVFQHVKEEL